MEWLLKITLTLFVLVIGLCFGSFINVVVYRINNNRSPLWGRSYCPQCKHQLVWFDNIPLLSFILLKGHCRYCHSPISFQYPLVELGTAIITLLVLFKTSNSLISNFSSFAFGYGRTPQFLIFNEFSIINLAIGLIITYCLITIFVSDLLYYTVPTEPLIICFFIGLLSIYFNGFNIYGFILSAIGAGLFFEILHLATHKKGMGFGDVEIAFIIGFILGWPKTAESIMLAFLTGALVGVILILSGQKKFSSQVPFGPFLVFWLWLFYFYNPPSQFFEKLFLGF